jgi:hypothetical protein
MRSSPTMMTCLLSSFRRKSPGNRRNNLYNQRDED